MGAGGGGREGGREVQARSYERSIKQCKCDKTFCKLPRLKGHCRRGACASLGNPRKSKVEKFSLNFSSLKRLIQNGVD